MDEIQALQQLDSEFNKLITIFPGARSRLVDEAGEMIYNQVLDNIDSSVKDSNGTGNLKQGVTKKKGSKGGYVAIKPDYNIAPHSHLLEEGHRLVRGGTLKKGGKIVGWVNGKHMYRNAINQTADQLIAKAEELMDKIGAEF